MAGGVAGCLGDDGATDDGSGATDGDGTDDEGSGTVPDVPMFRYDPTHTGHHPDATGPTEGVTEQWRFQPAGVVAASPAVVDGTVYAGGSTDLHALDAVDGTELWHFAGGIGHSSPAVVDGTVYVGGPAELHARHAEDGSERWTFPVPGDPYGGVSGSPTVADGTVYFGGENAIVYAVDAATGTEQWSFGTEPGIDASPAVADGTVYVPCESSVFYALDAADGSLEWEGAIDGGVVSSPAVADVSGGSSESGGATVYVGARGGILAMDADDGSTEWHFDAGSGVTSSPAVVGSDGAGDSSESDGATVYFGSYDGNVYALDATEGTEQWSFQTGNYVDSSPAVIDGVVYVGSEDGNVYALDAAEGTELWSHEVGSENGGVYPSPAVTGGTVYVGGNGWVYALG